MRIDLYLVSAGHASSRERAQALISDGKVLVNEKICQKNSTDVSDADTVTLTGDLKYVGRGALKLECALDTFSVDVTGKTVLDVGASTGGFTDCCLQRGAAFSVAVDVGHGQLAPSLASDPRVKNLEGVHIKDLHSVWQGTAGLICADVSFLSLSHVLPYLVPFCDETTDVIVLVKPQFEVRHRKSVIRDPAVHRQVLRSVISFACNSGFSPQGLIPSPLRGTEGNVEFLLYLKYHQAPCPVDIDGAVKRAHERK